MTKSEYISALRHYLRELSPEEQQKQLDYYAEMLADMLEDGLSMEEVVARLGAPEALAEEVLAAMGRPLPKEDAPGPKAPAATPKKRPRLLGLWVALAVVAAALGIRAIAWGLFGSSVGDIVTEIRREILDELDLDERGPATPSPMPWGYNPASAANVVPAAPAPEGAEGVMEATPPPQPVPTGTVEGAAPMPVSTGGFASLKTVQAVEVNWGSGAVQVVAVEGDGLSADTEEESGRVKWYMEGDTLVIEDGDPLSLRPQPALTLYVPAGLRELEVETDSGDISVENLSLGALELSSASGDVSVTGGEATAADLSAASGAVSFFGSVEALEVSTVSGAISVILSGPCQSLDAESSSGSIEVIGDIQSMEAENTSGSLTASFASLPQRLEVETLSGDVSLALPAGELFSLDFRSASGRVSSSLDYGGGGPRYAVTTGSGDLSIVES